nr:unnamed protein product [Callosobruchus chinensis]
MVQAVTFSQEIKDLQYNGKVNKNSKLFSLYPFLDQTGIIRVGGRLSNSWLANDKKHPVVLPPNHNFTKLLIEQEHINLFHAGTQATLSSLRCKYWIINGKNAVKQQLHKCVICFKVKPRSYTPLMGDLPESRVTPARPFLKTGCDFAGPVMMKDGRLRTRSLVKAYICIFVCFVTHAVHIELAGELTTECFLNCLKRFVSRRGLCQKIYTDNGKNFVGAERELKRHYKVVQNDLSIKNYLSERKIKWKFIPPVSPHFGGLWEAAVKSAKYHLTRVLREAYLNYEQLYTVLSQIEAILNSRPLTSLSSDPRDLLPLTPSHFLIGDLLMAVPEPSIPETPFNRLRLYQRMQQLVSHFWKRWSEEYITSLQGRTKWQSDSPTPIKVGSLVLLKEPTLPQHWRLGRVVELHPGKDNILRVVSVYTRNGIVKRSVLKLCCLPVET